MCVAEKINERERNTEKGRIHVEAENVHALRLKALPKDKVN